MKIRIPLLAAFALFSASFIPISTTYASSFDCSKASNKAEILVCGVPELSELDVLMAKRYREARQVQDNKSILLNNQRAWLKQRNQCEQLKCLRNSYQQRINELERLAFRSKDATLTATPAVIKDVPTGKKVYFMMDRSKRYSFETLAGYCSLGGTPQEIQYIKAISRQVPGPKMDIIYAAAPCRELEQFRSITIDILPHLFFIKKSRLKHAMTREQFLQGSTKAAQGNQQHYIEKANEVLGSLDWGMSVTKLQPLGRDQTALYQLSMMKLESGGLYNRLAGFTAGTLWRDHDVILAINLIQHLRPDEEFSGNLDEFRAVVNRFLSAEAG